MPIETPRFERGVLVDFEGYFIAAYQWLEGEPTPVFNRPQKGQTIKPADRVTLLRTPEALAVPSNKARWNGEGWDLPDTPLWVVDAKGSNRGKQMVWADRLPPLPDGLEYVDTPAPVSRTRRPLWTGTEWAFPTRVALVTPEGVVDNVVLENPRADQPNVETPPGWERFDDLPTGNPFPTLPDGSAIGAGDTRGPGGEWSRPEPPAPPEGAGA